MANISRRTLLNRTLLLGALGVGAATGVTRSVHHKLAVPPPPPPAALTDALNRQRQLLAGYDAAVQVSPNDAVLAALRSDVSAHGSALRATLERYAGWRYQQSRPSSATTASAGTADGSAPVAGTKNALAAASKTASTAARQAGLAWPVGEVEAATAVPLLGSIAASLATHAAVLA